MQTSGASLTPIILRPIGVIRSPHTVAEKTPIQPVFAATTRGTAELQHEYEEGLVDLEGFSHLWLIYVFHQAGEPCLTVKPFLDDEPHGVFATRAPCRPNPIGMSLVRLVGREGPILHLEDVDVLDGTPLLDIKPYIARFDVRDSTCCGWHEHVDDETAGKRGRRGFEG